MGHLGCLASHWSVPVLGAGWIGWCAVHSHAIPPVLRQCLWPDMQTTLPSKQCWFQSNVAEYLWIMSCTTGGLSIRKFQNHFCFTLLSQKVMRAARGLGPTSQLPWWCYITPKGTIWEQKKPTSNWIPNFARKFCEVSARKGLIFLAAYSSRDPHAWSRQVNYFEEREVDHIPFLLMHWDKSLTEFGG